MELTGHPEIIMKLWFKRNTRNLSMVNLKMSQLREIEDSGFEMELERRS